MTPKFAVIGFPLGYSLSPKLHNAFFDQHQINAEYISYPVDIADLPSLIMSRPFDGFNVTIPHKEAILNLLDKTTERGMAVGAVNTVKLTDEGYVGTNTDSDGFNLMLQEELGENLHQKNILLLGAGGAAKAICHAALTRLAKNIMVYDIEDQRAHGLQFHFHQPDNLHVVYDLDAMKDILKTTDVLINATPVGMNKDRKESILTKEKIDLLPDQALVIDAIYSPLETPLLAMARERGLKTLNGVGMLAGQGILAQEFWFGKHLDYQEAKTIIINGL